MCSCIAAEGRKLCFLKSRSKVSISVRLKSSKIAKAIGLNLNQPDGFLTQPQNISISQHGKLKAADMSFIIERRLESSFHIWHLIPNAIAYCRYRLFRSSMETYVFANFGIRDSRQRRSYSQACMWLENMVT